MGTSRDIPVEQFDDDVTANSFLITLVIAFLISAFYLIAL